MIDVINKIVICLFISIMHSPYGPIYVGYLFVFNVPSTVRSFRDRIPIYCPLRRTWSSVNTPFPLGIKPRAVAWQSITLPLRHASSTCRIQVIEIIGVNVRFSVRQFQSTRSDEHKMLAKSHWTKWMLWILIWRLDEQETIYRYCYKYWFMFMRTV